MQNEASLELEVRQTVLRMFLWNILKSNEIFLQFKLAQTSTDLTHPDNIEHGKDMKIVKQLMILC